ncbi:MAG: glycosyltransferase [Chloroflexi bacterium]|nr:glycosyltransferase [Chloroflexota bacterium]
MRNSPQSAYDFGKDVLGPIIHYYLHLLDHHMRYLDDGNTKFLYVSRAGVRIKALMDVYRTVTPSVPLHDEDYIWMSRILTVKACYTRATVHAQAVIKKEFPVHQISDVVRSLLATEPQAPEFNQDVLPFSLPASAFGEVFDGSNPVFAHIVRHFAQVADLFDRQLRALVGGKSRVVLIDSGWQGTSQTLLESAYPEYQFVGLYVATTYGEGQTLPSPRESHGLLFEKDEFDASQPITALWYNRHVMESLFEPKVSSIETLVTDAAGTVYAPQAQALLTYVAQLDDDAHYLGVCDYLAGLTAAHSLHRLYADFHAASQLFAQKILYPTKADVALVVTKKRTADFGRSLVVPVVYDAVDRHAHDSAEQRVREAIWIQGQIAVEYPDYDAEQRQRDLIRGVKTQAFFHDPNEQRTTTERDWQITLDVQPRVLIVMRTKNRPVLLRRALESVYKQTYTNYMLVIVNDGGRFELVQNELARVPLDLARVVIVSNRQSVGMEAASNLGIRATSSDYVVVHDDDDSWHPQFLQKSIGYLESSAGRKYGGVVTRCIQVVERVRGEQITILSQEPYKFNFQQVYLAEMVRQNFFAPISFVYRRAIYDKIGGYDEALPVLGDWDFNLRFLLEADIGVLDEELSYYHHREAASGSYANSVTGGISKHVEYDAIVRNRMLRQLTTHDSRLSTMLAMARYSDLILQKIPAPGASSVSTDQANQLERYIRLADERWAIIQLLLQQQR